MASYMIELNHTIQGLKVYLINNQVVLEQPSPEEYKQRLINLGLFFPFGRDRENTVGQCWYRAYTKGKEG